MTHRFAGLFMHSGYPKPRGTVKAAMCDKQILTARIPPEMAGMRLDQALARLFPDYSRARLQSWIREGNVRIGHTRLRPRDRVNGGELVRLRPQLTNDRRWAPQPLALNPLYEDPDILVIDKSPGVVVHPGAGHADGTLVNALLHYAPELGELPRAGIIHRIDKDTSGLLVVARSLRAHHALVKALKNHDILREYEAIVTGVMTAGGHVDAPVGRHPVHRTRMAVLPSGKSAVTHFRVIKRYRDHTHIRLRLETGRTHQVRVHMAHIGHPLVGDPQYGGRPRVPAGCGPALSEALRGFRRQALHASCLQLHHPAGDRLMSWRAPVPADMAELLNALQLDLLESVSDGTRRP